MSEIGAGAKKPACVVIDTNIWHQQPLLNTPIGVSFLYTIGRQRTVFGLPEVIETEVKKHVVEIGMKAATSYSNAAKTINLLTGAHAYPAPTAKQLEEVLAKKLLDLKPVLERVPITVEHTRAALSMVNAELPPNGEKNQQFKDSLIWQAVLTLAEKYLVHFVTSDSGFYEGHKPDKGELATNLKADCDRTEAAVSIHNDLNACLTAIRGEIPNFDRATIALVLQEAVRTKLDTEARQIGAEITDYVDTNFDAFRTGQSDQLAIDFKVIFNWRSTLNPRIQPETTFEASAFGSCYFTPSSEIISDIFVEYIFIKHTSPTGHGVAARSFDVDPSLSLFPRPSEYFYSRS